MSDLDHSTTMDDDVVMMSFESAPVDVVRWQGPQSSCPALNALLAEASRPTKKPVTKSDWPHDWDSPGSSNVSGSRNSPSTSIKSRPTRLARDSPVPPSEGSPTLVIPFFNGSPADFLSYLEGVREKADENTRRKILTRKQATRHGTSREPFKSPKEDRRTPYEPRNLKRKEPVVAHRSLPDLSAPTTPLDSQFSRSVDVDASLQSPMAVDVSAPPDSPHSSRIPSAPPTRTHLPPPPVPVPKYANSSCVKETTHFSPNKVAKSISAASDLQPIKVHPPLPSQPQSQPRSQVQSSQSCLPRSSQSSRPPVLGMRRTTTYSTLNRSQITTTLPNKQKGFKPPLSRPRPPSPILVPVSSMSPDIRKGKKRVQMDNSELSYQAGVRQIDDADKTPSSPSPEADTSYGDISFDMDPDALEEVMKLYD